METWTNDDHGEFGDGPWASEPDKAVWVDPATDLDCMIIRNHVGALCGYAGVGPDHVLHGTHYSDSYSSGDLNNVNLRGHLLDQLSVHGGITYSASCDETGVICHVPQPGRTHDVWWFGFDCAHACDQVPFKTDARAALAEARIDLHFDGAEYRNFEYVRAEVENLARQLSEIDSLISD